MAFVFRSEKKEALKPENLGQETQLVEETKKEGEARQGNVCKGLPFLAKRQGGNHQKENVLPLMEANPIHQGSFNFKNAVFKVRELNNTKLIKAPQQDQKKPIMIVKEISSEKLALSLARLESKKSKANNQSVKELSHKYKEESGEIVSKNLLKTMLHLSQKAKQKQESQKIVIGSSKSPEQQPKKNRFKDWKSLKKLSPLKDYSKFNVPAQPDCKDISCGPPKSPKEEEPPKKREAKVRVNPRKLIESTQQISDSQDEYVTQATPGPGAYSYNVTSKKQFRSKRKKFQKIFYSQIERFQENQKKFQEVTYINDEHQPNSKDRISSRENSQPFMSKSPKFPQKKQCESPPPGYYDTRQTLEHDLVRHILKSSNSTTFINRSPRVFKVKGDNIPGPGTYALDKSLQKLLEQKNQLSFSYKSQQQRKIDHTDQSKSPAKEVNLMEEGERVNPIHMKQDSILEDYYYTEPVPFLSSTERFPQQQPAPKFLPRPQLKPDTTLKATPPRSPFNSSQKRQTTLKLGDGIGIGLYNLCKDTWSKKSYNILYQQPKK